MNPLFILIVFILLLDFVFDKILDFLNLKNLSPELPKEAEGIYDAEKYKKSQEYYKVNHNFSTFTSAVSLVAMLAMLFLNGFAWVDTFVRQYTQDPILMPLLFFGILGLASDLLGMPFSLYQTFVIEEKFGFNKTTLKTFMLDKLKGYFLAIIIG
jgi:STE24 endopeptidase